MTNMIKAKLKINLENLVGEDRLKFENLKLCCGNYSEKKEKIFWNYVSWMENSMKNYAVSNSFKRISETSSISGDSGYTYSDGNEVFDFNFKLKEKEMTVKGSYPLVLDVYNYLSEKSGIREEEKFISLI